MTALWPKQAAKINDEIVYADTAQALVELAIGYAGLLDAELGHQFTVANALAARAAELDAIATEYALIATGKDLDQ